MNGIKRAALLVRMAVRRAIMLPWTCVAHWRAKRSRVVTRHGYFEVATTPSKDGVGFMSWAKRGKILGYCPITEPGDPVWFSSGRTREEARDRLLAELGLLP
jgi:hypothetical protein